ncbi:MAG: hypothetical protein ACHQUC_07730 [Chlamydiales bacterium]
MRYWFILLFYTYSMLLRAGEETSWQTSEQGCFIELKLSQVEIQQLQPLLLQATFRYPESYQLDEAALINQLLWHANPFEPRWVITQKTLTPIKQEEKGKQGQSLHIEVYPASMGTLFLSLLDVSFTDPSGTRPPIQIATPQFEIKVVNSEVETESLLAPLLALEPQFPLYLSSRNRQLQSDPFKLAAEEKRNVRILREHSFPWAFLLLLFGIGLAGRAAIKFRQNRLSKQAEATQMLSCKQRVMQTLHHLKVENFSARDLYINLSNLCLEYLSERFKRKTSFFSPEELEPLIESFDISSPELKKELNAFLMQAYYVKFANDQPTEAACEKALKLTEEIILFP